MNDWRKSTRSYEGDCAEIGAYRKATFSHANGNCAEIGAWRKASFSASNGCLEAGTGEQVVGVRDTKQKDLGYPVVLEFSPQVWCRFLDGLR